MASSTICIHGVRVAYQRQAILCDAHPSIANHTIYYGLAVGAALNRIAGKRDKVLSI